MHPHGEGPLADLAWVLLAQRARRGVARVHEGGLAPLDPLRVHLVEPLDRVVHLPADLDHVGWVVVGEPEWEAAALAAGAGTVVVEEGGHERLAVAAASAFTGADVDPSALAGVALPGRLERRGREIRDGAHNPAGVRWLVERLPRDEYTVMASMLSDKNVDAMLAGLARVGKRFVATRSTNARALPADELAARARRWFESVESRDDPAEALAVAHALGEPVLVTGSLYLLADLERAEGRG